MTVTATLRRAGPHPGNGSATSFPFTFKIFANTDVQVLIANADGTSFTGVLGSDYSVTINLDQTVSPGGSVNYPLVGSPLPVGATLTIGGALPYNQPLGLPGGGNFNPVAIENQLDRTTIQIQQIAEAQQRSFTFPLNEGAIPVFPTVAGRANRLLGFDALGQFIGVLPTAGDATSLAIDLANAVLAAKGPGQVGFGPNVAYAAGTVGAKLRQRRNLRDCGLVADGNYGTGAGTDNSAALQAAINALAVDGGGVLVDDGGIYKLSSQVVWPDGVSLQGAGKWSTIFFAPTAFANAGGLFRIAGVNGYPTCLQGFALLGQTGGAGGAALVSVKNGVFVHDLWVTGFVTGAIFNQTDNFLGDFAIEICTVGISILQSNVNILHGTVYECTQGVVVANNASTEPGRVTISDVRASSCPQDGFVVSAGKNVTITGCGAGHLNAGRFTSSGITVDSSSDVIVNGFAGDLSVTSTTGVGIKLSGASSEIVINGSRLSGWTSGIQSTGCNSVSIVGNQCKGNGVNGILVSGGDKVLVSSNICEGNGTGGAADSGISANNSAAGAVHTIIGNQCVQAGGGPQDYGISCAVGSGGYSLVQGNTCLNNNIFDINLATQTGNIRYGNNVAGTVNDVQPSVAAAAALTLPVGGDFILVSGNTGITSIVATGNARRTVTLRFSGTPTVTDGSNLKLNGNFVATADDTLTLYCDGVDWFEVARSAN